MLSIIAQTLEEVEASSTSNSKESEEMRVKTRVKTPELILGLLEKIPTLTLNEIAEYIGKSPSTVERAVAKLKQQQKLAYKGPKKSGEWVVLRHGSREHQLE